MSYFPCEIDIFIIVASYTLVMLKLLTKAINIEFLSPGWIPSLEALTFGAVKILRNIWDNWELALDSFSKLLGYKTLL